ncbi:MAG: hypothetical protein PVG90_00055 [Bacillota bacterium]|jgi:hypothetical protein
MKKLLAVCNKLFGWGIYITLLAGGIAFFGFLIGIILGESVGSALAIFIHQQYFPVVIRITSIIIGVGLVVMYLRKEQALSLVVDQKEAEDEMAKIKQGPIK